ncbi:MAG: low affinity iron permease family protein [Betaproteobacteria bacterium]|nr:MAG: low affinity iron permease family protein [Betaproteobacteria bacterium]
MRPTRSKTWFTRFAKWTAKAAGRPIAFTAAVAVIALWALTGPIFGFSDTWQLIINTGTTIITFLMVFLIQSTQNRDSEAIQVKLDELIRLSKGGHNALLDLEELEEAELDSIRAEYCKIAEDARAKLRRGQRDTGVPEVRHEIESVKRDVQQEKRELAELKKRI